MEFKPECVHQPLFALPQFCFDDLTTEIRRLKCHKVLYTIEDVYYPLSVINFYDRLVVNTKSEEIMIEYNGVTISVDNIAIAITLGIHERRVVEQYRYRPLTEWYRHSS